MKSKPCTKCHKIKPLNQFRWCKVHRSYGPGSYRDSRCIECHCEDTRERHRHERRVLIAGYGGRCTCCGESRFEFLSLDHVNGGGTEESRRLGNYVVYRRAIKENFPARYRLLCHNCNLARGAYGKCPHESSPALEYACGN